MGSCFKNWCNAFCSPHHVNYLYHFKDDIGIYADNTIMGYGSALPQNKHKHNPFVTGEKINYVIDKTFLEMPENLVTNANKLLSERNANSESNTSSVRSEHSSRLNLKKSEREQRNME